jgi:hypothetical protein
MRFAAVSGITAIEFDPLFTAYSVSPSGDSVTVNVRAPVCRSNFLAGARASISLMTRLVRVSMTATWSALSCAT